ncbi:TPA: hypothetical protein N0F65_011888 [Lagenidium giganteum]|uniref:HIT domain-containing protein n=1 Tax=Lagenidium giganteum TaxID=4803 RepID=A0AAV2YEZ1_9STRA|nr:TPA: hypothetical protein N0F65_011888 [Lagenidium giganteum]
MKMPKAPPSCIFCCVETLAKRNRVLFEDALVIGMVDGHPRATRHLLVIAKEHIPFARDLKPHHADLVAHMLDVGNRLLESEGLPSTSGRQFGFHMPPFASIHHLHMHCLGLPFVPAWNRFRYTESFLGSYVDAERLLQSLKCPPSQP